MEVVGANDIKPAGVSNSHGRTEPDAPAKDRHATDAIAEAPTSPADGADQPEHAAAPARPWPSVKQPTVRPDRFKALNPSAMRPWTPRHDGLQRPR